LQVKLSDPCLSALEVLTTMRYTNRRILYFTLLYTHADHAYTQAPRTWRPRQLMTILMAECELCFDLLFSFSFGFINVFSFRFVLVFYTFQQVSASFFQLFFSFSFEVVFRFSCHFYNFSFHFAFSYQEQDDLTKHRHGCLTNAMPYDEVGSSMFCVRGS